MSEPDDDVPPVEGTLLDIGNLTIRRVPASQLSYFPPSTQSLSILDTDHSSTTHISAALPNGTGPRNRSALPISFKRSGDGPLQGVLDVFSSSLHTTTQHIRASTNTLFGHPIPRAPTTIVSRLSLESTSGTPSSVSDDFDWEHEMEDVSTAKTARRANGTATSPSSNRTRTRTRSSHAREASASLNDLHASPRSMKEQEQEERNSVELDFGPFQSSGGSPRTPTHRLRRGSSGRSQHTTSDPGAVAKEKTIQKRAAPYAGVDAVVEREAPRVANVVRTAQMEPSPGMQLPLMVRRVKSTDPFV